MSPNHHQWGSLIVYKYLPGTTPKLIIEYLIGETIDTTGFEKFCAFEDEDFKGKSVVKYEFEGKAFNKYYVTGIVRAALFGEWAFCLTDVYMPSFEHKKVDIWERLNFMNK